MRRHWSEILRLIATIYTSKVSASDLVRALQRDGHPTALAEAIATYGRIFKTFHILSVIDSPPYRRGIKGMRNLQEGRHALAEKIFHGRRRELFQRYREGMEDQLGALRIVLNCVVLWNTVYIDAVLNQLRAQGYPVRDEDVARLSPFMRSHINVHGKYSLRVIHVRRLFGNKMRLIQLQVSVSTYCYHPGSNGPGSEKPWIDSTFA